MNDFRDGVLFWVRGWGHIVRHRSLFALALAPFAIAILATAFVVWILYSHLGDWAGMFLAAVSASHAWIGAIFHYPLLIAASLLIFLSSIYVVYVFQALLAVPFNSWMAARTLRHMGKNGGEQMLRRQWAVHTLRMIALSLIKASILLTIGVGLFVLSFFPILNVFTVTCTFLILAADCMDYTFDAAGLGLGRRLAYLFRWRGQWLGMATGLALTLLVPGLTLLAIPGAVVGAAMIFKPQTPQN